MRRWSAFILHPLRMNSVASQSSSSGWLGEVALNPKLSDVGARPTPKCHCQIRLTMRRAKTGLSGDAIQRAKAMRRLEDRAAILRLVTLVASVIKGGFSWPGKRDSNV